MNLYTLLGLSSRQATEKEVTCTMYYILNIFWLIWTAAGCDCRAFRSFQHARMHRLHAAAVWHFSLESCWIWD